jgi:hypothetical protein
MSIDSNAKCSFKMFIEEGIKGFKMQATNGYFRNTYKCKYVINMQQRI